jgi:hypothetical protein
MKLFKVLALVAVTMWLAAGYALAGDARTERVKFAHGSSSASISDQIEGEEYVVYKLRAKNGQFLRVNLSADNENTDFNIYIPGRGPGDEALYNSATGGKREYYGQLYKNGEHSISVFQNRNAARKGRVSNYDLFVEITDGPNPDGGATSSGSDMSHDAKVPGTDFHATGPIACSMGQGQPTGNCNMGVKREGNGSGMVFVTKPDGSQRVIYFERGKATGYDQSQADSGHFKARREGDLSIVHIGEERYEIYDSVIYGG